MRLKLITIYLLMISALLLVGYISYQGLNNLIITLQSAVQPDEREIQFEKIQDLIIEAENSIRMYTITRDIEYIKPYNRTTDKIEDHIQFLYKKNAGDSTITASLDRIFDLIQEKIYVQEQLIILKQRDYRPDLFNEVMEEISSLEEEINQPDTIKTPTNVILPEKDTVVREKEEVKEEPKKKRGFFARLFGGRKKEAEEPKEDTIEIEPDSLEQILAQRKDTVTTIVDKSVDISKPIQETMQKLITRERYLEEQISEKELELTLKDNILTSQVRQVIENVKTLIHQQSIKKASEARTFFTDTTRYITIVGTIAAMLFLVLIFILMRDFQVILKTKKQLETAKANAEHLAKVKEDFLASMSHEIRTPLNAIIGFAKHIRESKLSKSEKDYLHIIKSSSGHLLEIINEILDFSKLDAGKMKIESTSFNLNDLIHDIISSFSNEAKRKNLELQNKPDPKLNENNILSDPFRVRQIISNLVANAIKFTDKGYIRLHTSLQEGNLLKIDVTDSGCGIPDDKLETIFEKFNQADSSTTRKYGGTGLGLTLVKMIAELMDGTVTVKSIEGKGSTFTVVLPVEVVKSKAKEKPDDSFESDLKGKSVLIVDDDPFNLLLLEKTLTDRNAKVKQISNGKEVVDMVRKDHFDLIILDLQMPEIDGYTIVKMLRKDNYTSPAIALSAYINDEVSAKCLKAGFNEVISKPFEEKHLLTIINELTSIKSDDPSSSENGIHPSFIEKFGDNNPEFVEKMVYIYYENVEEAIKVFENHSISEDLDKIKYAAHKLIPSSRHMGMNELVINLKKLENCEKENESEIKTLYQKVIKDLKKIRNELNTYLKIQAD